MNYCESGDRHVENVCMQEGENGPLQERGRDHKKISISKSPPHFEVVEYTCVSYFLNVVVMRLVICLLMGTLAIMLFIYWQTDSTFFSIPCTFKSNVKNLILGFPFKMCEDSPIPHNCNGGAVHVYRCICDMIHVPRNQMT